MADDNVLEMKHLGFGKYEVAGQKFESKKAAQRFIDAQLRQEELEGEIGDVLPEGYELKVHDRTMVFRNSLMDLAMNEIYTPSGEYNKYYDREWIWAWAALISTDISDKQARGYKLVTLDDLKKGIEEDRYPEHILSLVREEGSYLVYGDSVLMRMPRVLWRQQKAERLKRDLAKFKALDDSQRNAFDQAGVGIGNTPVTNELQIKL
jgi:hypothetical protein